MANIHKQTFLSSMLLLTSACGSGKAPQEDADTSGDDSSSSGEATDGDGDSDGTGDSEGEVEVCDMAMIPGGIGIMGCDPERDPACSTDPAAAARELFREVELSPFEIDCTEVTVGEFRACVEDGGCEPIPPGPWEGIQHDDRLAVIYATHAQAAAFCAWEGKRLPTSAEWERAARGVEGRLYPWGDEEPTCAHANVGGCADGIDRVGRRPLGATPEGVHDLAGNATEHVSDRVHSRAVLDGPTVDPVGDLYSPITAARGSSFFSEPFEGVHIQSWRVFQGGRTVWFEESGFRCVRPTTPLPVCGNGVVETPELCDDGNDIPADGCSNACQPSGQAHDIYNLGGLNRWYQYAPDQGQAGVAIVSRVDGEEIATLVEIEPNPEEESPRQANFTVSPFARPPTAVRPDQPRLGMDLFHPDYDREIPGGLVIDPNGGYYVASQVATGSESDILLRHLSNDPADYEGDSEDNETAITWSLILEAGEGGATVSDLEMLPNEHLLVAGSRPSSSGEQRAWLAEIDPLANEGEELVWEYVVADDAVEPALSIKAVAIGDDGQTVAATGQADGVESKLVWTARFDAAGQPQWEARLPSALFAAGGPAGGELGEDIAIDSDGKFWVAGTTWAPEDAAGPDYRNAATVLRYSADGELEWRAGHPGTAGATGKAILLDPNGSVVLGGTLVEYNQLVTAPQLMVLRWEPGADEPAWVSTPDPNHVYVSFGRVEHLTWAPNGMILFSGLEGNLGVFGHMVP